jgi:uncharacterized protein YutE (UPF0331/DUF86 family)/predicted nucleotidyltransferase
MTRSQRVIGGLRAYFARRDDVAMAFLFGSRGVGRQRRASDWDIAVYLTEEGEPREQAMWADVERLVGAEVDLVVLNRAPATVADVALRGVPLVIKDRGRWLEFMLAVTREATDYRDLARDYAQVYWRSTSLSQADRYALERRVVFLNSELADLPAFSGLTQRDYEQDRHRRRDVERLVENLMNAVMDIAKIVLASEKRPIPETYRDVLYAIGAIDPFHPERAEQLAGWAGLRNVLAHEYLDLRWKPLSQFLQHGERVLHAFLSSARTFLAHHPGS